MKNKRKKQPAAVLHNVKVSQSEIPHIKAFYWIVALIVGVIIFMFYIPALKNGFMASWDDNAYVHNNPEIRSLDFRLLKWSFSAAVVSLWHPLTLLSIALDYALWGLNPWGYHLTNNLLHASNTSLVFILTFRLIKLALEDVKKSNMAMISGVVTAFLFGLHPLHVESVAWVSERKDVLSAFFFLLSLLVYIEYIYSANLIKILFYVACLLLYILALMSKPMAVSLPIVLLILDFYPLKRLTLKGSSEKIIIEKLPFFFLSFLTSFMTIYTHQTTGGLTTTEQVSIYIRSLVAVRGYIFYILKMILPLNLAPLYPLPPKINPTDIEYLGSAVILILITYWCIRSVKENKLYLSIWMYYIVTLLPVIGIVQVGSQAAADRYTYLPSLGPFLLGSIVVVQLFESYQKYQVAILTILILIAGALVNKTVSQISIWKDPITLWSHEINLFPNTAYAAYGNRGLAYYNMGKYERAIIDYDKAIAIRPPGPVVYINRGLAYNSLNEFRLAILDYNKAIELEPNDARAYINRGGAYYNLGEYQQAIKDYSKAIDLNPKGAYAYYNLALIYSQLGDDERASINIKKAANLGDKDAQDYLNRQGVPPVFDPER